MATRNPFEEFIETGLGKAIDEIPGRKHVEENQPTGHKIAVDANFIIEQETSNLTCFIYETKYSQQVNRLKPMGVNAGGFNFQINILLETFVEDYLRELEYRGVLHKKESHMIGNSPLEGVVHKQTYYNASQQMANEVNGIMRYLIEKYT